MENWSTREKLALLCGLCVGVALGFFAMAIYSTTPLPWEGRAAVVFFGVCSLLCAYQLVEIVGESPPD